MFLQRSSYFRQLLFLATILVVVAGARAGRIKGVNHGRSDRRLAGKKKFHGPKRRECTTSAKDHEVKFECKSKTSARSNPNPDEPQDRGISIVPDPDLIKDKIKYKIKTENDGISVKLEYKNEIEMEDNTETETKTKFELLFYEIVEYVKKSNDDIELDTTEIGREEETEESGLSKAYDWNQDEIVQSFPLTEWMDIPDIVDADDGIVSYFTATTANLGMEGGTVAFNFTISRADMDAGESITANSMKIDVLIKDFPWSRQDSYVAILSTLKSVKKIKVEYDQEATVGGGKGKKAKDVLIAFDGEDTMESTFGFSTYGEYLWANEAAATGLESLDAGTSSNFSDTVMTGRKDDTDGKSDTDSDASSGVIPGLPTPELLAEEVEVIKNTSTSVEVVATSPEGQNEDIIQSIAYSFVGSAAQGASDIYWDPQTGIGYQSSSSPFGCVMGLAGTALVALFFSL